MRILNALAGPTEYNNAGPGSENRLGTLKSHQWHLVMMTMVCSCWQRAVAGVGGLMYVGTPSWDWVRQWVRMVDVVRMVGRMVGRPRQQD
jgi:hypothetical protein